MIQEAYCSFEVSKLLKEKGFNEPCKDFYRKENEEWLHRNTYEYNYFNLQMPRWEDCYSCPTHQMAMAWLREKYRIDIVIEISDPSVKDRKYYCVIWDGNNNSYILDLFNSYEQSCEAALKYSLENLI